MNAEHNEASRRLAEALGVDVSAGRCVTRVELTLAYGEAPQLRITRFVDGQEARDLGLHGIGPQTHIEHITWPFRKPAVPA